MYDYLTGVGVVDTKAAADSIHWHNKHLWKRSKKKYASHLAELFPSSPPPPIVIIRDCVFCRLPAPPINGPGLFVVIVQIKQANELKNHLFGSVYVRVGQ